MAHPSIRLEAIYHLAFAHWVLRDYDEAEKVVVRALQPHVDGVAPRATALRGWIRVGKLRYAEALPFFRGLGGGEKVLSRHPRVHRRALSPLAPGATVARLHATIVIPAGDRLPPAQSEIVRALCASKTPRDVAAARGTSVETVRNQIKQIYQRIDVHSVEELRRRYAHPSA